MFYTFRQRDRTHSEQLYSIEGPRAMPLVAHYNLWLVLLSYLVAVAASYAAFRIVPNDAFINGPSWRRGIVPAAMVMGAGIWSMHFIGMASFHLGDAHFGFRWDLTTLSLLVAIVFTGVGFWMVSVFDKAFDGLLIGGVLMASGILMMHFLGMMAMTGEFTQYYRTGLVLAAAAIAFVASVGALWFPTSSLPTGKSVMAAILMGIAICGMHYLAMAATVFTSNDPPPSVIFGDYPSGGL